MSEGVSMETIFDHDPTAEELRYFVGVYGKDRYLSGLSQDEALEDLAGLFAMRGDAERATGYAQRIADQDYVRLNISNQDFMSDTAARKRLSRAESRSKAA